MITTPISRATAEAYIRERIVKPPRETGSIDVDVEAIAADLYDAADSTWDISGVDQEVHWSIIERHAPAAVWSR